MKFFTSMMLAGSSLFVLASSANAATPATAQDSAGVQAESATTDDSTIIVTARRKDERLQDVPLTVNAVTSEELNKLNIRRFEDVVTVVPGLALANNANGIGATATVRGVNFDVNASGNNGTIEFYLNDSPISVGNLLQATFDVGQIELLRGPQGTLRGRASPSGSMTVTTHKADLSGWGGYVSATGTTIGGINANAAINIPVVKDMLAIRVSGIVDNNEADRVTSIHDPVHPYKEAHAGRVALRFDPTDSITITAMYQRLIQDSHTFPQVESQSEVISGSAASPTLVRASDRLAVADIYTQAHQTFDNLNFQAQWAFAGQKLNYAGAMNKQHFISTGPLDAGDFFAPNMPDNTKIQGQFTNTHSTTWAHELRLSSDERLFGMLDYTIGGFMQDGNFPTDLTSRTLVLFGLPAVGVGSTVVNTPVLRRGGSQEKSAFGNLTLHFGDKTEVAGGLRYIDYKAQGTLQVGANIIAAATENVHFTSTIWSASVKHRFSDDLMIYASAGSSWRPGLTAVGDFSVAPSALETSFVTLKPESSKSYEIGFKASAFDKKLRVNVSAFHQDFTNYPYRSASGVFYVSTDPNAAGTVPCVAGLCIQTVKAFNFVAAVPVHVDGGELEINFAPTRNWDISLNAAYAMGKIKDGLIPCNDYSPRDGVPDSVATVPSVTTIQTATGGGTISSCRVTQRSSLSAPLSGNFQTEYRLPISSATTGFMRGLVTVYGDSQNDPTNPVDNVKAYALVNLFAGIRDPKGAWEISLYAKNVTETGRVLTRSSTPLTTGFNVGATGFTGVTTYYGVTYTNPREFGLNVRYAFGTR